MIKEVEMARMHFIECEAEEIHGPLRGVPSEFPVINGEPMWVQPDGTVTPSVIPDAGTVQPLPPGVVPSVPVPPNPAAPQLPLEKKPAVPVPPKPELPLDEGYDDELFDVPAPPPDARRGKSSVQQAGHETAGVVRSRVEQASAKVPAEPRPAPEKIRPGAKKKLFGVTTVK